MGLLCISEILFAQQEHIPEVLLMGPHVVCCLQNISQRTISKLTSERSCFWLHAVSGLLCGQPEGGRCLSKRAAKVDTSPARRYLIVHHRSQPPSLLEEAKSLIWTATGGEQADHITVGVLPMASVPAVPLAASVCYEL